MGYRYSLLILTIALTTATVQHVVPPQVGLGVYDIVSAVSIAQLNESVIVVPEN